MMSHARASNAQAVEPTELIPRSIGDIFDEAFDLYKRNFALFAGVAAAVHVPAAITMSVLTVQLGLGRAPVTSEDEVVRMFGMMGILLGLYAVYLLLGVVEAAALSAAISDAILGRRTTIAGAYRRAAPACLPLTGSWILIWAATGVVWVCGAIAGLFVIGMFTLSLGAAAAGGAPSTAVAVVITLVATLSVGVLPALVALLCFVTLGGFISQISVIERAGFVDAIVRNAKLLAGRYVQILGGFLLLVIIYAAIWVALELSIQGILQLLVYPWVHPTLVAQRVLEAVSGSLITLALHPYALCVITLLYYDQRIRREGFDLALMGRRLSTWREVSAT